MSLKARRFLRRLPDQTPIPTLRSSRLTSYMPVVQADMEEVAKYRGVEAAGYTRPEPYVISQFDARPINAIDFIATFDTAEQTGADLRTFNYRVPAGRVAIIRRLDLRCYMSAVARNALTAAPLVELTASFLVNGNAQDQINTIRVDDSVCGVVAGATADVLWQNGMSIPLYFLAKENDVVTLTVRNATAAIDFAFVAPILYGNLLLAEGLNPTSEPGTKAAVPVFPAHNRALPRVSRQMR